MRLWIGDPHTTIHLKIVRFMFISYSFSPGGVQCAITVVLMALMLCCTRGSWLSLSLRVLPFVLLTPFPPRGRAGFQMLLHSWCIHRQSLLIASFSRFSLGFMEPQNECWHRCSLSYIIFLTPLFCDFLNSASSVYFKSYKTNSPKGSA